MALIVIPQEDLERLITEAVRQALPIQQPTTPKEPERVNKEQGLLYLETLGYTVSKSLFYKATSAKEIPCTRFGRRLIFNTRDLVSWAESKCRPQITRKQEVSLNLAKQAASKTL